MNDDLKGMDLHEFQRRRLTYFNKTKERDIERMNLGQGIDDTPWYMKVTEEMLMDFIVRLEAMEELMKPAPEAEKPKGPGNRFR